TKTKLFVLNRKVIFHEPGTGVPRDDRASADAADVSERCVVSNEHSSYCIRPKLHSRPGQATMLVYSLERNLDIIINVPLTPDVVDAVNRSAKKDGLSTQAWIAMTIDNALQRQDDTRR